MQQAFYDFFRLLSDNFYNPLVSALQNNNAFNSAYNFIGKIINAILGTELSPINFGATVIASGFTLYIAIASIAYVIKIIKLALGFITNIFDDQFNYNIKKRRKKRS